MSKSWYSIQMKKNSVDVEINDVVGMWGVNYKSFKNDLEDVGKKEINLSINSPGGVVFDGLAIYDYLNKIDNKVNVEVIGMAGSISSVIAMVGNEGGNTLKFTENAVLFIHNAQSLNGGDADQLRKTANELDKVTNRIKRIYLKSFDISNAEITDLMDVETILYTDELVDYGVIDDSDIIGEREDLVACIKDNWRNKYNFVKKITQGEEDMAFGNKELKKKVNKLENKLENFEDGKVDKTDMQNVADLKEKFEAYKENYDKTIKSLKNQIKELKEKDLSADITDLKELVSELKDEFLEQETPQESHEIELEV